MELPYLRSGPGGFATSESLALAEEERVDVGIGAELGQVGRFLAGADVRDWRAQLFGDREGDAALRRAVELGNEDVGDVHRPGELFGLDQSVLSCRGVDDQDRLLRRLGDRLLHDAAQLGELCHEVVLGVQPAGGVDDQHVDAARVRRLHGIEDDGAGVRPLLVGDHRRPDPLAPDFELVDRRRAEGVAGGDEDVTAKPLVIGGKFGDRGRLADSVDADDHDDEGNAALQNLYPAVATGALQQGDHLLAQDLAGEEGIADTVLADPRLQIADELLTDVPADVGLDEEHLQLLVEIVVEGTALEEAGDLQEDTAPGLLETLLQLGIGFALATKELQDHRGLGGLSAVGYRLLAMSL